MICRIADVNWNDLSALVAVSRAHSMLGAARLLGLSASVAADALAIGFYLPPFALFPGFFASDAKLMTAALPAANGLYAVSLASAGLRGARDILEHRHGFANQFAFVPSTTWLTLSIR